MISVLLAVLSLQPPGAAAQWVRIWERDGEAGYVDVRSLETTGDPRRAWQRFDFASARQDGAWSGLYHFELSCAERSFRVVSYAALDRDGNAVWTSNDAGAAWPVREETPIESLYDLLCGRPGRRDPR